MIWKISVIGLAFLSGGLAAMFIWRWFVLPIYVGILAWMGLLVFTLYFFRDYTPHVPLDAGALASPAHGRVDTIDEIDEPIVMGGKCHRVSIFLSIFDVHVQHAPATGVVEVVRHTPGRFLNALNKESAVQNENSLMGIRSSECPGERIGVRLIAGAIARRIVEWVKPGDVVQRGDRIGLIQFGSRCDLYMPLHYRVCVKTGDKVIGGETIIAASTLTSSHSSLAQQSQKH